MRKRFPGDPLPDDVSESDFEGIWAPGDIEYAMLMSSDDFDAFISELSALTGKIDDKVAIKGIKKGVSYAKTDGSLLSFYFSNIQHNGQDVLTEMRSACSGHFSGSSNFESLNFAVIKKSARLDLPPYMDFK